MDLKDQSQQAFILYQVDAGTRGYILLAAKQLKPALEDLWEKRSA